MPHSELYCTKSAECQMEPADRSNAKNRPEIAFPKDIDRASVIIKLWRWDCEFGGCYPMPYEVIITGEGAVTFISRETAFPGKHEEKISVEAVDSLLEKFRAAEFFSRPAVTDGCHDMSLAADGKTRVRFIANDVSERMISLSINGAVKTVDHYTLCSDKMDKRLSLDDLVSEIDKTSGSVKWAEGTVDAIDSLKRADFDFTSPLAADMVFQLILHDRLDVLKAFLEEGAVLHNDALTQYALMSAVASMELSKTGRYKEMVTFLRAAGIQEN